MEVRYYNPQSYCDTRMAQSKQKVFNNFSKNWSVNHSHYIAVSANEDKKPEKRKEARIFTKKMEEVTFVTLVLGLKDLLDETRKISMYE